MPPRSPGLICLGIASLLASGSVSAGEETRIPVVFSGGHETDSQDNGRPVALVAGALGVKPEVFRQAFSGVRPAGNGRPTEAEARRNKDALLKVLRPHGVTNDRLDEVSDYYRYRPQAGEKWPTTPAQAVAIVEGGKIKRVEIVSGGAGYSSPPKMTVKGFESITLQAELAFDRDFRKNGTIKSIAAAPARGVGATDRDR